MCMNISHPSWLNTPVYIYIVNIVLGPATVHYMRGFTVYALLKVVGYYDLSDLSMSVIGFKKKVWMVGGWVE